MKKHPWRDYNGFGKGITVDQLHEILAEFGIYPVRLDNGEMGFRAEQFKRAFQLLQEGVTRDAEFKRRLGN
jgi:hypothetical protein